MRELIEDEGQSRAEAVAWVLTFEPETPEQLAAEQRAYATPASVVQR